MNTTNANEEKNKEKNSAGQDRFFLLLFKRKCWNVGTDSKDACAEV